MSDEGAARITARIALGRALRAARLASGLSGVDAGLRLGWSQSKVSRIEAARVRAEVEDVEALVGLYGLRGRRSIEILRLAKAAAGSPTEWRNSTRIGLPRRQQDFVAFEAAALSIVHHQTTLIPGPMQTRAYASRVLEIVGHPDPERAIETRMARRDAVFRQGGPLLRIVLSELAVRWNPGPDGVLADQLAQVADLSEGYGAALHVVPIDREQRAFLAHPVVIYDFGDDGREALVETTTMDVRVTHPAEVDRLTRRLNELAAVALDTQESVAYVRQIAERSTKGDRSEQGPAVRVRRSPVAQDHPQR